MRVRPSYPAQSMQIHLTSIFVQRQDYLIYPIIFSVGLLITGGIIIWIVINQNKKIQYVNWSKVRNEKWMSKQFFLVFLLIAVSGVILIQFT